MKYVQDQSSLMQDFMCGAAVLLMLCVMFWVFGSVGYLLVLLIINVYAVLVAPKLLMTLVAMLVVEKVWKSYQSKRKKRSWPRILVSESLCELGSTDQALAKYGMANYELPSKYNC